MIGELGRFHPVRTPRQLLAVLAAALVAIGVQTLMYAPEFLAFSPVWNATTLLAGASCAAAAVKPRRIFVAISGATVVTSSCARGLALVIEVVRPDHVGPGAPLVVGATTWAIVALLAFVTWREYVLPWSITVLSERRSPESIRERKRNAR